MLAPHGGESDVIFYDFLMIVPDKGFKVPRWQGLAEIVALRQFAAPLLKIVFLFGGFHAFSELLSNLVYGHQAAFLSD